MALFAVLIIAFVGQCAIHGIFYLLALAARKVEEFCRSWIICAFEAR